MTVAAISILGFIAGATLTWARHPVMQRKWIRILPHVNDTLLLVAALTLAFMIGQYPFVHGWLTVKVLALVLYIGLGVIVIKQRGPAWFQGPAFVLAVLSFSTPPRHPGGRPPHLVIPAVSWAGISRRTPRGNVNHNANRWEIPAKTLRE